MKYDKCARCGKNMTPPNGVADLIGAVLAVKISEEQKENPDSHALLTTETKPPLGIMPKKFWLEKRIDDLKEAVIRYIRVGRVDMNMVKKLLDEIVDTEVELAVHEAKEVK